MSLLGLGEPKAFASIRPSASTSQYQEQTQGVVNRLRNRRSTPQQASPKRRHVGLIWNMYVSEERRGTGLADMLFKYVLETASLKVDQVELYVAVDNPRGTQFYRRFGFESYGVMPRALRLQGADFDALMMVKEFR